MLTYYGGGLPHFVNHLAPIWRKLPGEFYARGRAAKRCEQLGIPCRNSTPRDKDLVVVASFEDHRAVHGPTVLVNHGVGQRYAGDPHVAAHPSYSGGEQRDKVKLFICPSERDAATCRATAPAAAVGVPYLDPWLKDPSRRVMGPRPLVAITFHADITVCPETRWAYPHFRKGIQQMIEEGTPFDLVGHGHPRAQRLLEKFYPQLGIRYEPDPAVILDTADLLVFDNTSFGYEFASTGRPVVVMNAPGYRRDVHHGLRFWNAIPGIEVDHPELLGAAIEQALEDPPWARQRRQDAVAYAYDGVPLDGYATDRAVDALLQLVDG